MRDPQELAELHRYLLQVVQRQVGIGDPALGEVNALHEPASIV